MLENSDQDSEEKLPTIAENIVQEDIEELRKQLVADVTKNAHKKVMMRQASILNNILGGLGVQNMNNLPIAKKKSVNSSVMETDEEDSDSVESFHS